MRLTILYNRDIHSNEALNHLLPSLATHDITLLYSCRVGANNQRDSRLNSLAFFEQGFFTNYLFAMVDKASRIGERLTFKALAGRYGATDAPVENINSTDGIALLESSAPDLILSIRFGQILKDAAISVSRLGVINLHSGLLPNYRGVMATFRAMQASDSEIGLTVHWIDSPAIDQGGIIETLTIPTDTTASYLANVHQLYAPGAKLLTNCVDRLNQGESLPTQAVVGEEAYFSFPNTADLNDFESQGHRLFDDADVQNIGSLFLTDLQN
ncbi:MAG: formyltransferase family protein [Halieaceae bacterium]